jgi:hypothetical protein
MIKYRLSGFNDKGELVMCDILAESVEDAVYTSNLLYLDEIIIEEMDVIININ